MCKKREDRFDASYACLAFFKHQLLRRNLVLSRHFSAPKELWKFSIYLENTNLDPRDSGIQNTNPDPRDPGIQESRDSEYQSRS